VPDPSGQFANEIKADRSLGEKLGLQHTPTIIVCSQREWVQVTDPNSLYQTIDQVAANAGPAAAPHKTAAAAKKSAH